MRVISLLATAGLLPLVGGRTEGLGPPFRAPTFLTAGTAFRTWVFCLADLTGFFLLAAIAYPSPRRRGPCRIAGPSSWRRTSSWRPQQRLLRPSSLHRQPSPQQQTYHSRRGVP